MPKIIVKTGTPQDGEYDLDLSKFSWRERAFITEVSGVTPPEYLKKWFDVGPMTGLASVAVMMQRAGKVPNLETLMDAEENAITVDYSDLVAREDDASPPDEVSPLSEDERGEPESEKRSSGGTSSPSSDGPGTPQSDTGNPGSDTGAE